jgi:hypothetical protein
MVNGLTWSATGESKNYLHVFLNFDKFALCDPPVFIMQLSFLVFVSVRERERERKRETDRQMDRLLAEALL